MDKKNLGVVEIGNDDPRRDLIITTAKRKVLTKNTEEVELDDNFIDRGHFIKSAICKARRKCCNEGKKNDKITTACCEAVMSNCLVRDPAGQVGISTGANELLRTVWDGIKEEKKEETPTEEKKKPKTFVPNVIGVAGGTILVCTFIIRMVFYFTNR